MTQSLMASAIFLSLSFFLSGCDRAHSSQISKEAEAGSKLIASLGCGGCHIIPGIKDATGVDRFAIAATRSREKTSC